MPKTPRKPTKPRVLILCRRQDMMNYSMKWATEMGFEAYGAINNEDGIELLEKKAPFVYCALGCLFVNDTLRYAQELKVMKAALDDAGVPHKKMPVFGDVRSVFREAGLIDNHDKLIEDTPVAAIAG